MGMSIEDILLELKEAKNYPVSNEAIDYAINTIHKHQKIQEIINNTDYIQEDVIRYKMICGVIEDGN